MLRTCPLLRAVGCCALATATVVATGWPAAATATPPPTTPPVGTPVSPAPTNQLVVDDTLTISVAIPTSWSDVSTAPGVDAAGNSFPQIAAAPDLAAFQNSFDTSGVFYAVQPFMADTASGVAQMDFSQACTDAGTTEYVDGYFTGHMKTWTNCGGGQGQLVALFVNPPQQQFSAVLQVGLATPADRPALDLVMASFFIGKPQTGTVAPVPGTNPSSPTPSTVVSPPPLVPTVPTTPGASTTVGPAGPAADGVVVEDDTQSIGLRVPATWIDVSTAPATIQGGSVPTIVAAPDLNAFQQGAGPGVIMTAAPYAADPQTVMASMAPPQCVGGQILPYEDPQFRGFVQTFENCNGHTVSTLAINRADVSTATIIIQVATTPDDTTTLNLIGTSFNFGPAMG